MMENETILNGRSSLGFPKATPCDDMLAYLVLIIIIVIVLISSLTFIFIVRYSSGRRHNINCTKAKWGLFFSNANEDSNSLCWDNFDSFQAESHGINPSSKIFKARCVGVQPRTFEDLQKSEEKLAEKLTSVPDEEVHKPPKVKFTLKYNTIRSTLVVHVLGVQNAPKRGKGEVAYYITLRIFPLPHRTFHTRAIESGIPLQFNELFEFEIVEPIVLNQSLKIIFSYFDRFSHHDVVGDLVMDLADLESRGLTLSREILLCKELNKIPEEAASNGEIMLSLGYLRLTERLAVVVIIAKNLGLLEEGIKPDPFVEISLLHGRRTMNHKRTATKVQDCNPVFNESLTFHIPFGLLHQSSLLVNVKNDSGSDDSSDVILGQVLLGPEASGIQFEHWNEMRANNKPIARWHKLQAGNTELNTQT